MARECDARAACSEKQNVAELSRCLGADALASVPREGVIHHAPEATTPVDKRYAAAQLKALASDLSNMLGAIAGDVIGSVHDHLGTKSMDFVLFPPGCRFTDDTVLTVAVADCLLNGSSSKGHKPRP